MSGYNNDATAANNTSLNSIAIAGSSSPANIDNALRELSAQIKQMSLDLAGTGTVAGTAQALTLAPAGGAITAYYDGLLIGLIAGSDNTGADPTLNISSLGAKKIKKADATGAEADLVAGDLQSGGLYFMRYRTAWASAAGAFQLIDLNGALPSAPQFTTIELGHASDTTLSRDAAGVAAVEGNLIPSPASQAEGDLLYRGASSWSRLAKGTAGQVLQMNSGATAPEWATPVMRDTAQATTSGTTFDFTIPATAKKISVILDQVSLSGTDDLLVQIGDSGGIETTGYTASSAGNGYTAGFGMRMGSAGNIANGVLTIYNITGNIWVASGTHEKDQAGNDESSAGRKQLSAALTTVRLTRTGTNTFDGGQVNVFYE